MSEFDFEELIKIINEESSVKKHDEPRARETVEIKIGEDVFTVYAGGSEDIANINFRALGTRSEREHYFESEKRIKMIVEDMIKMKRHISDKDLLKEFRDALVVQLNNTTQMLTFVNEHFSKGKEILDKIEEFNISNYVSEWKNTKMKSTTVRPTRFHVPVQELVTHFASWKNAINMDIDQRVRKEREEHEKKLKDLNEEKQRRENEIKGVTEWLKRTQNFKSQSTVIKHEAQTAFEDEVKNNPGMDYSEFVETWWETKKVLYLLQGVPSLIHDEKVQRLFRGFQNE